MTLVIVALLFFLALCVLARWANARFRHEDRLPMQWWLNGDVTWSAPRPLALAFIPALALPVFASVALLPPRPGQESIVLPVLVATGATFVAIQLLHVWLIEKTIRRNSS
jgi:hypothetical protein